MYNYYNFLHFTDNPTPPHTPTSSDPSDSGKHLVKKADISLSNGNNDLLLSPFELNDKKEKEERSTIVSEGEKIRYILYIHIQFYYARKMAR